MHLTAFSCIFLPLYTHLGQAHIIFAAENLFYLSPFSILSIYSLLLFFLSYPHIIYKKGAS